MTVKMKNAPVYYALARAQFNPIIAMEKYVGDIQDELRHKGYTLFERHENTQLQLGQTEPQVNRTVSWLINKEDKTAGFILNTLSLTFHTTHYVTKQEFIPELLDGLNIVNKIVELDHINRLGLRYLDAVLPSDSENVNQYLIDQLHGMNFNSKQLDYSYHESVFQTECQPLIATGKLIARIIQLTSILGYPPGLSPHGLVPMVRFALKQPCSHAIIDTDHFVEGKIPLEFKKISQQLFSLHDALKKAFEAITTDHAKNVWFSEPKNGG